MSFQRIGSVVLKAIQDIYGSLSLLRLALKNGRVLLHAPVREVFYRQLYFVGMEAIQRIAFIALLIGAATITQIINIVGLNAELTGKILAWTVVRELGPLLTAIIVTARSAPAIAAELGAMRVGREIDYLRTMGISPINYLVVPRVFSLVLSIIILTFYFQIIAIGGGILVTTVLMDAPFILQLKGIFTTLEVFEIVISIVKSAIFGFVIASVSCYHGLSVQSSITEIPQATTIAVMQSLFRVFILDVIITVVVFV